MNRRTTLILVGLAALLAVYVWYSGRPGSNAAGTGTPSLPTPIPGSGALFKATAEQIAGMSIVDKAGNRSVALSKDAQGNWQVTAPDVRPADPTQAQSWASQFANVFVSTVITQSTDLTPFGVISPTYTAGVKLVDGTNVSVSIGDKVPTGSGYYVLREGEPNVVVVDTSAIDGLVKLLGSPPYFVPTATPSPTGALTATVTTPTGTATPSPTVALTVTATTPTGTATPGPTVALTATVTAPTPAPTNASEAVPASATP
jgi:uncharacterized protein DUF4340